MNQDIEHQMLILWMKLSEAIKQFAETKAISYLAVEPWNCDSEEIKKIWSEITAPRHLEYLEAALESLKNANVATINQAAYNLQIRQTRAALQECKRRQS